MQNKSSKLCFSTLGCFDLTLDGIFGLCEKYCIRNIEIRGIGGELDNRKIPEFAPEIIDATVEKFKKAGISPVILGTSCEFHKEEKFDAAIEEGKAAVKIAAKLGARGIRVFGNRIVEPVDKTYERVIRGIKTLCDFAADKGVDILLETHGDYIDEKTLSPITEALGAVKNFGIIWDIEHTPCIFDGTYADFYKFAKPFVRHVHIKDRTKCELTLVGCGIVPIKPVADFLAENYYGGLFSLEWEKKWHPELPSIEAALEKFVKIMEN